MSDESPPLSSEETRLETLPSAGLGPAETGHRMEVGRSDSLVWVSGEVEVHTADELHRALLDQAQVTPERVVVDMSGVTFMDSMGLRALVTASRHTPIQVVRPSELVAALFFVTGLEDEFGV